MYGNEEAPQQSGEGGENQAAEEEALQPSVWTPDGGTEPAEAPASGEATNTNREDEEAAGTPSTTEAKGLLEQREAAQGNRQTSSSRQKNAGDQHDHVSYFVGGLHPEITRAELEEYLSAFAPVEEIDIKMDVSTGRNRGYAFISVRPPFDAEGFINAKHTMRDKPIDISKPSAERQAERPPERRMSSSNANRHKIFIGGITPSITDEILYNHFEQFGSIEKANVIRDATGKSRGFGFVQFTSVDSVAVAVDASPHQLDPDNRVDAQPAQDRGARRPPFATQYGGASPYYEQQGYYGYGYGGSAAAGPYGYHQAAAAAAAAAAYPSMYTSASPYGAYAGAYGGAGYYAGYSDAYGAAEGGAAAGYAPIRRGDEGSSSGYPTGASARGGAPY